jgi:hypothetical protein
MYSAPTTTNVENNDTAEQKKPLIPDTLNPHGDTLKQDSDRGLVKLSTV